MIRKFLTSTFTILPLALSLATGQANSRLSDDLPARDDNDLRICFYNVENFFDYIDDPDAADDAFTPQGNYEWNWYKYQQKANNIAKTIIALGKWAPPALVGLAEVENWQVLFDLTNESPLQKFGYRILHENSPDPRGVDVGLIYLPGNLKLIQHQNLRFRIPESQSSISTRDILFATFKAFEKDTLHVFVNHWPSRYDGKEKTEKKRVAAARILRVCTDSLLAANPSSKILIMGDFNDDPDDLSISQVLGAGENQMGNNPPELINLMHPYAGQDIGTIYHKEVIGRWHIFDQIIVSKALINEDGLRIKHHRAYIFKAPWLLDANTETPRRSFRGPIFVGGFSDHLPVFVDIMP